MLTNTSYHSNASLTAAQQINQYHKQLVSGRNHRERPEVVGNISVSKNPVDSVSLSPQAQQAYAVSHNNGVVSGDENGAADEVTGRSAVTEDSEGAEKKAGSSVNGDVVQLSAEAQRELIELKNRDEQVKRHEAAHAAVGGSYAGAPSMSYETGPDGKRYAVSGEVRIDTSEVRGDPAATMKKADVIRAAALAPQQPSAQDRLVAAKAAQMKSKAQAELMAQSAEAADKMVSDDVAAQNISSPASAQLKNAESFKGAVA